MMMMRLMKSMFQSYYIMLISIEIKWRSYSATKNQKQSSANDRGAAHVHAYDRHTIVTTIEQQNTRERLFISTASGSPLPLSLPVSHKPSHNHVSLSLSHPTNVCWLIGVCHILVEDASNQPCPRCQPHWNRSSLWKMPPHACEVLEHIKSMRQVIRQRIRVAQRARELELSHVDENELQDDDPPTSS